MTLRFIKSIKLVPGLHLQFNGSEGTAYSGMPGQHSRELNCGKNIYTRSLVFNIWRMLVSLFPLAHRVVRNGLYRLMQFSRSRHAIL